MTILIDRGCPCIKTLKKEAFHFIQVEFQRRQIMCTIAPTVNAFEA